MPRGGRGGDGGGCEDGGGEGGWRFASKREEAVAVAVAEGSSAAWRRGSVVGQAGGLDRARSRLRVAAHPVASDARPQRRDRGHRRLCWGAARAARAALFAARACRSRSRATAPCQRGRGGRCHTCARVYVARVGWRAARARAWKPTCLEPGKRQREEDGPSSSGRRADRLPLLLGQQSAVAHSSSSSSELSCSGSRDSMCAMDRSIEGGRSSLDHLGRCPGRDGCRLSSAKRACMHQSTIGFEVNHTCI